MSEEVNQVITAICEEQCMLSDKVQSMLERYIKLVDIFVLGS